MNASVIIAAEHEHEDSTIEWIQVQCEALHQIPTLTGKRCQIV